MNIITEHAGFASARNVSYQTETARFYDYDETFAVKALGLRNVGEEFQTTKTCNALQKNLR